MDSRIVDANCEYLGVPRLLLMENAGKGVAGFARGYDRIIIFCGTGNNGGDGLVAARHLAGLGKRVRVYALSGPRTDQNEFNLKPLLKLDSVEVEFIKDSSQVKDVKQELDGFDCIIDALVGVGLSGELREPVKSIVEAINESKCHRISVDAPSGSDNLRVNADVVVSLHSKKTEDAVVVDIGIPREAELYCGPGDVVYSIPARSGLEHKGDYGRVLVVGGSVDYVGAPSLAALGALRTGCDLVYLAVPSYVADHMSFNSNFIVKPLKSEHFLREKDVESILESNYDVLVLGNGLGVKEESREAVRDIVKSVDKPMVLDADALKLIKPKHLRDSMVLTPHAGEFKILFDEYSEEDRMKLVEKHARDSGATILLKGSVDVVSNGERTRLNKSGNPALTVGGTGDVLAGVIAGLIAQNKKLYESACAGAFLNGLAGDLAFSDLGYSLLATDVVDYLPDAIKYCMDFR